MEGLDDEVIVMAMEPVGMRLEVLVDHPDGLAREEAVRQETIPVRRGNGEIIAVVNDPSNNPLAIPSVVGLLGGRLAASARVFQLDGHATLAQEGRPILPCHGAHGAAAAAEGGVRRHHGVPHAQQRRGERWTHSLSRG